MKWNSPEKTKDNGDWRIKTRFAWLPVRTTLPNEDTIIWLESYQTKDKYQIPCYASYFQWETIQVAAKGCWDDKEE